MLKIKDLRRKGRKYFQNIKKKRTSIKDIYPSLAKVIIERILKIRFMGI